MFWWTNETLNTWTHLLGWIYFAYFTVEEVRQSIGSESSSTWQDGTIFFYPVVVDPKGFIFYYLQVL
jgi:predicted membrane channel-forming protein YqfA (hemolysin III family)